MADAEQAARPAGDDTADELRIALERIRDRVARGDEAWRWAQELARDTLAAHVGQRDGGVAGDDTAPRGEVPWTRYAGGYWTRPATGGNAAAAPGADTDTASLKAGDTVPVRWLDRAGYHYGTGEINPADGDSRPLRVTLRRRNRRDGMPSADFADSVPRAPVEALLAALDANGAGPHVMAAADDVRRHLNGDT